jgi:hypothetical protein
MNTRTKIMGLAALPLAVLLATGGVAMAQGAGAPAGTQVVQQAAIHNGGGPCPQHVVKTAAQPACQHQQARDRDCANCGDHQGQAVQTAARVMDHARDGSCDHHADHGDR